MWDHSTFSKNRDRLLEHEVVEAFFTKVMGLAERRGLLSREHFSVDGTLIQAWAGHKSFRPRGGRDDPPAGDGRNADTDWRGQRRSNETHQSSTDPDARLFRKSKQSGAILAYQGHILMENRSGLVVGAVVSHADGFAERASVLRLLDCVPGRHAKTLGTDKGYDMRDFVGDCRISQVMRKRIEEHFGWGKTVGRIRQTVCRGMRRVDQHFKLTILASNLTRIAQILAVVPQGVAQ
ncbi:hypothetical protein GO289_05024 [Ralstonia solanacearum]|nr:hypothetical protein [Ralstonia solanacearum]